MNKTPETDDLARGNHVVPTEWAEQLECERDEAREKYDKLATEHMLVVNKLCEERDEARRLLGTPLSVAISERNDALHALTGWEKKWKAAVEMAAKAELERDELRERVKELIYIAVRAIDLAEIDFENDKFGVVSELRSDLEKIKKST